jgi:branched-chain amino acid transport system permease protein
MEGPVIGAIIFYLLQRYLADFGAVYLILLGTLGILIMLFAPRGLWGLVSERFDVTLFPTRRWLIIDPRGGNRA